MQLTLPLDVTQRLERIKANQARLAELNLVELAQEVSDEMAAVKKAKVLWGWCVRLAATVCFVADERP